MAKPILFVVHGMGKHGPSWEKEIKKELDGAMGQYSAFRISADNNNHRKFSDLVRVVPINYDQHFEKMRKRWGEDAKKIITLMTKSSKHKMQEQLSKVEASNLLNLQMGLADDSFFNTHVLDVLLYRFTLCGEAVRVDVAKQMVKVLAKETSDVSFGIMAHSLGTSVVHDTLHALYTQKKWRQGRVSKTFSPGNYQASQLIMVSNVSRVLQSSLSGAQAYNSKVKPGAGGVCKRMLNIAHDFDPFAQIKPFTPGDQWLAGRENAYRHVHLNSVTRPNVHGFTHYLNNPAVNSKVLALFSAQGAINKVELAAAVKKYNTTTLNKGHKALAKKLQNLKISEPKSWQQVWGAWKDYSDVVGEFADDLGI